MASKYGVGFWSVVIVDSTGTSPIQSSSVRPSNIGVSFESEGAAIEKVSRSASKNRSFER